MTTKATTTKATATRTRKATATKAAPAKKATTRKAPAKGSRAFVTGGRFDASDVETHKCEGKCRQTLPVKKFPTITGTPYRIGECRACRDARTKADKEAKAAKK